MLAFQFPGPVAVIDVETTGVFPFRHDRVIEIAAVVLERDGCISREFVSLVNPARDIGPSSIHGLHSEDILHAPRFEELAAHLLDTLEGTTAIAGHNVRFDRQFLECEFERMKAPFADCVSICTMQLAGGGRLGECCAVYGVPLDGEAHSALIDARAAARLLVTLLADQPRTLQSLNTSIPIRWPTVARTDKRPVTRDESRRRQAGTPTFLQHLLSRVYSHAAPIADDGAIMAYTALLDRVLEDRHIDDAETDALIEMATKWGLTSNDILRTHREYLHQLALTALADGIVTDAERRDLALVARLLGYREQDVDQFLREAAADVQQEKVSSARVQTTDEALVGKRVCFTGELQCRYDGQLISREVAEELATKAGLVIVDSVTKKLDLLVVADPHTQSGKAKKARQYGIRIMHEPVFWKALGVNVQ